MYLVILCAHGISKNEFSTLKIGGGGGQKIKKLVPHTHTCAWQSTVFKVFVILEVLEKYSCRILWSIWPYPRKYMPVYSENTGTFPLPTMAPFSSTTAPPCNYS